MQDDNKGAFGQRLGQPPFTSSPPTSNPPSSYDAYPPTHPLDPQQQFSSSPFPSSTFIELSDLPSGGGSFESEPVLMGGGPQPMASSAEIRSRTTSLSSSDVPLSPQRVPRQAARPDQRRARRDYSDEDNKKSQRPGARKHEEEPIIDEILAILPPPVSQFLVKVGKIVYPSLQLLNVRTDLEETGEAYVFNTQPKNFLKNFTSGLSFHAIAMGISLVLLILTEIVAPTFWDYPFFFFTPSEIPTFWKFFIWGGLLASLTWYLKGGRTPKVDRKAFITKAVNGLALAVLEEFGYRWLYICLTMIVMQAFNMFIHYIALWLGLLMIVAAICILIFAGIGYAGGFANQASIQRFFAKYNPVYVMLACLVGLLVGILLVAMGLVYMIVFDAIWDYVIIPVCNFFSGWQFDDMFNGWFNGIEAPPEARRWRNRQRKEFWKNAAGHRFFIYSMVLSNLTYRDGHKYQGLIGWINSWYVGLVLLSAMVHYGFFTALAVHLLYELEFIAVGWVFRRFQLARPIKTPSTTSIPM